MSFLASIVDAAILVMIGTSNRHDRDYEFSVVHIIGCCSVTLRMRIDDQLLCSPRRTGTMVHDNVQRQTEGVWADGDGSAMNPSRKLYVAIVQF